MNQVGVVGAALALVVAGVGCKKKSLDVEGRIERARAAMAKGNLGVARIECALDWEKLDRTQAPAKELVTICEHDMRLQQAAISLDFAVEWAKTSGKPAADGLECQNADNELGWLDANEPAVKELRARQQSICKRAPAGVAEAPAAADPAAKPDADAATVTVALPAIEKAAMSDDPAMADPKCIVLIEETERLVASTDLTAHTLGVKIDNLCNYTAPLRTIELGKDCASQEVNAAFMLLGVHKHFDDAKVTAAIDAWNKRCPANRLELPGR